MTVRLVRSIEIARIAHTAGFDTLLCRPAAFQLLARSCGDICMAGLQAGIAPFVRVGANASDHISRVLDAGALGIIAPQIDCAQAAREVVRAAKFPPWASARMPASWRISTIAPSPRRRPHRALNDATMIIVQIESAAALANAEEIVAVDGIDLVLIGLNDLLADWGIPGSTMMRACAGPMRKPLRLAAIEASTAGSAGSPRAPTWRLRSSRWARATSPPDGPRLSAGSMPRRGRSR